MLESVNVWGGEGDEWIWRDKRERKVRQRERKKEREGVP